MVAQSPSQFKASADQFHSTHQVFLNSSAVFPSATLTSGIMDRVMRLASQRAVVIFSVSSCCMCHTIKTLFCDLGVSPAVHELDEEPQGREMEKALAKILGRKPPVPAVFIGGRLVGSTDRVMSLHLEGGLVPMLHDAGAL